MGVCLFDCADEGVLVQVSHAICYNETFQVNTRLRWHTQVNFLVAVVYCPGKHRCIHTSIADTENVERICCPGWPKRVELEQEIHQILIVWNVIQDIIHISLGIWKPNACWIINKKKTGVSSPSLGKICEIFRWPSNGIGTNPIKGKESWCTSWSSIENNDYRVSFWLVQRVNENIMKFLISSDIEVPAIPFWWKTLDVFLIRNR